MPKKPQARKKPAPLRPPIGQREGKNGGKLNTGGVFPNTGRPRSWKEIAREVVSDGDVKSIINRQKGMAKKGGIKSAEFIRDTMGEKPGNSIKVEGSLDLSLAGRREQGIEWMKENGWLETEPRPADNDSALPAPEHEGPADAGSGGDSTP